MTRILIVDDKEENLYYLRTVLTSAGCAIESAGHGAEALFKARQHPPDLIVSDLLMPVMDGYMLLRHWKADARLAKVPFIVYTATYTEEEDEQLALSLGADAFILKPAEPEDFLARVREVQANAAASVPTPPRHPIGDEKALLKVYSETLIRKLEEKTLQLEEANRALHQDIAERKLAEEALRTSEAQFRILAEAMPQMVWITRPDGWNIYFNQQWVDYTGLTLEESFGHGWNKPFHPEDRPRALEAWQQATATVGTYSLECRLRRADGAYRWWLIRGAPQRDADGNILKWFGTCTDIHESKLAQARIEEQAALLDLARDAIVVRDLDHRIVFWSKGAERIYGWSAADAVGRTTQELIRPDPVTFQQAYETVLRDGTWIGELQEVTRAGDGITEEARWTLLRDAQNQPKSILAIGTDITERKKLEEQFLRAQRMESIGTLAGGIAHDLNNVLGPIIMSLDLLAMRFPDAASQDLLKVVSSSAQHGAEMVRQVLSFARGVEGQRMEVQIKHLIREVEQIARDTFLKHIQVRTLAPHDLWTLIGDPTQLHQVLVNLCVNARDAMPAGGELIISAENVTLDAEDAGWNLEASPGPYVFLQVEDTGTGMPPELIEKIFDPFFTTKEVGKGTGLGLSTSLAIVKSHGGFIRVSSQPGKGTKFQIHLPAQTEAASKTATEGAAEMPRGHGELILVADDEASVRQITRQTLEAFGYRVIVASDGAEAVSIYATRGAGIAVVLTDMMMPGMGGEAMMQILRRMNPAVRIIGVSGLPASSHDAPAAGLGSKHFLPKPYTAGTLLQMVQRILAEPPVAG